MAASYDNLVAQRAARIRGIVISALIHAALLGILIQSKTFEKNKTSAPSSVSGTLVYLQAPPAQTPAMPEEKVTLPKQKTQKKQSVPLKQREEIEPSKADDAPVITPEIAVVVPPQQEDMMAQIQAARKRRADTATQESGLQAEDSQQEESEAERANRIARENVALSQKRFASNRLGDTGGVFEIRRVGYRNAEFMFRGWSANSKRNNALQLIHVDQGMEEDIQIATIKKMIEVIRTKKTGDFTWDSHRLGQLITLSARVEDTVALQQFLLREFFPDYASSKNG